MFNDKYCLFAGFLTFVSFNLFAAGQVNFLEVDDDVVIFSTTSLKSDTSLSCVVTDSLNLWSVSLESNSGRSIYSLLLTSMATGADLNVESANDCADRDGIERANKVNAAITVPESNSSSVGSTIGFYTGDGVTRLGTVLQMGGTTNSWYYVDSEGADRIKYFENNPPTNVGYGNSTFYFTQAGCAGTAYLFGSSANFTRSDYYNNGEYVSISNTERTKNIKSRLNGNGGACIDYEIDDKTVYSVSPSTYVAEPCGYQKCIVKVDSDN